MNEGRPRIEWQPLLTAAALALSLISIVHEFAQAEIQDAKNIERRLCSLEVTIYKQVCEK